MSKLNTYLRSIWRICSFSRLLYDIIVYCLRILEVGEVRTQEKCPVLFSLRCWICNFPWGSLLILPSLKISSSFRKNENEILPPWNSSYFLLVEYRPACFAFRLKSSPQSTRRRRFFGPNLIEVSAVMWFSRTMWLGAIKLE